MSNKRKIIRTIDTHLGIFFNRGVNMGSKMYSNIIANIPQKIDTSKLT